MSDFDITNVRGKDSFLASLKKRKALGLSESDSESEEENNRASSKRLKKTKLFGLDLSDDDDDTNSQRSEQNNHPAASNDSNNNNNISSINNAKALSSIPDNNQQNSIQQKGEHENQPVPNPFLSKTSDLEFLKVIFQPPLTASTFKARDHGLSGTIPLVNENSNNAAVINLSDRENDEEDFNIPDEKIDDLDPELEALLADNPALPYKDLPDKVNENHEPQKIYLKIQYHVPNFDSLSNLAKVEVSKRLKPVKMLVLDNLQFSKVLDSFCKHRNLIKTDMILVYNDERVYLSATPAGVGMSAVETNSMYVYPEQSYIYLLEQKQIEREERMKRLAMQKDEDLFDTAKFESFSQNTSSHGSTEDDDEGKLILTLRGNDSDNRSFRVKPTTRLAVLAAEYKEKKGITTDIRLSFEGEILDLNLTVGETDLEDEDLVEVLT
ncbi:MAG: hypothetical protein EXX96DRAFT_547810 [Benjaminiella poitrasii]|nr:MAG: hypothetical protein EXX96DRAFT_547810 [Benjaminiella poitrasii]